MRDVTSMDRFTARRTAQQLRAGRPAVTAPTRAAVAAPAARPASAPMAAVAAISAGPATQIAAVVATAVAAERDRIRGILEAPEARGREESAAAMAYGGGFTVAQARNVLSTLRTDEDVQFDAFVQQVERSAAAKRSRAQQGARR